MSIEKAAFMDEEILSYGRQAGFYEDENLCLLDRSVVLENENDLFRKAALSPKLKRVADYAAASFMNPKTAIRVFGSVGENFIRFRGALPQTNDSSAAYAVIYKAGKEGYLSYESDRELWGMLYELSGFVNKNHSARLSLAVSPIVLLVILGACDVVMQNRYEGNWFTASSVENAFDLSGDSDFKRICAPIAEVASCIILGGVSNQDIWDALNKMAAAEILNSDEIDGLPVFSFGVEYRYIPNLFIRVRNRLAVCRYDERGEAEIYYIISREAETWAFTIQKGRGMIERLDETRLNQILDTILVSGRSSEAAKTRMAPKFCTNCGSPINPEARFCSNCGAGV